MILHVWIRRMLSAGYHSSLLLSMIAMMMHLMMCLTTMKHGNSTYLHRSGTLLSLMNVTSVSIQIVISHFLTCWTPNLCLNFLQHRMQRLTVVNIHQRIVGAIHCWMSFLNAVATETSFHSVSGILPLSRFYLRCQNRNR